LGKIETQKKRSGEKKAFGEMLAHSEAASGTFLLAQGGERGCGGQLVGINAQTPKEKKEK